jgi:hypothetical protein
MVVCSKRGPDCPAGRGRWFVDHVAAWFGDWGTTAGTGWGASAGTAALEEAEEDKRINAVRRRAAAARRVDSMLLVRVRAVQDSGRARGWRVAWVPWEALAE